MKKIIKKVYTIIKIIFFKVVYKSKVKFGINLGLSVGFQILIEKNGMLTIGNGVFFNRYCSLNCLGRIKIGDNCIFGEGVKIYDHNHKYKNREKNIKEQGFNIGEVNIGKNCWIGSNVTILNNVTIGDNTIIGANCLIYKSIPSNSIVKCNNTLIIEKN